MGDVDISATIEFHQDMMDNHYRRCALKIWRNTNPWSKGHKLSRKQDNDNAIVNAGFFVLSPKVFDYLEGDETVWENEPLENRVMDQELNVYKHYGFWQPMDTLCDKTTLMVSGPMEMRLGLSGIKIILFF